MTNVIEIKKILAVKAKKSEHFIESDELWIYSFFSVSHKKGKSITSWLDNNTCPVFRPIHNKHVVIDRIYI